MPYLKLFLALEIVANVEKSFNTIPNGPGNFYHVLEHFINYKLKTANAVYKN